MAALLHFLASPILNVLLFNPTPSLSEQLREPMFLFLFASSFSLSLLFFLFCFYVRARRQRRLEHERTPSDPSVLKRTLAGFVDRTNKDGEKDSTPLSRSLLLEILPPDSSKWAELLCDENPGEDSPVASGQETGGDQRGKKKKRRAKKKRLNSKDDENGEEKCVDGQEDDSGRVSCYGLKPELVSLYPFTSTSSATQRKIKQQYDQLVKCHGTKGLTLAQVGEFANCLIQARSELQQKSEAIKRKFTITKALLFKADRSSFDRLHQQIYKLEMEQKRLEEDAFVYNLLQQQLKLSPAYKKMLEISLQSELKDKSGELQEGEDNRYSEISFEELLAQEKQDSFWQKNWKTRLSSRN